MSIDAQGPSWSTESLTNAKIVSQVRHAFAEPAGHRRTREDTKARQIEHRRIPEEPRGHGRTQHTAGSGP